MDKSLKPVLASDNSGVVVKRALPNHLQLIRFCDDVFQLMTYCDAGNQSSEKKDLLCEIVFRTEAFLDTVSDNPVMTAKVCFLLTQLKLLNQSARRMRHTPEVYAWAAALLCIANLLLLTGKAEWHARLRKTIKNQSICRFLRDTAVLKLPSEESLRRLVKPFKSGVGMTESQIGFIKKLAEKQKDTQAKFISLHLKGLTVRPTCPYKEGKVSTKVVPKF